MAPDKVRWGVLGAASIAVRRAIPGMQKGEWSAVAAIASRDKRRAEETAARLGIAKAYGSYESLLADPEIEAVYNPLPNNLHVPWSIRAAEAGKHVLCEKPISTTVEGARKLLEARERTGVKIGEGFMVRLHPRWIRVRQLVHAGSIGKLRLIAGFFSFFNDDTANIRNIAASGGGALLDIGCYPIHLSRFIFADEPVRVLGTMERDARTKTDILTSAILEFPSGRCQFACSTQLAYLQRMLVAGTKGSIEIDSALNPSADQPSRIAISDLRGSPEGTVPEMFPVVDQFTLQGDAFSKAIRENGEVPVPLEDSVKNMAVIEAVFHSAASGKWEQPDAD
jgi:predicted dehydrogenase